MAYGEPFPTPEDHEELNVLPEDEKVTEFENAPEQVEQEPEEKTNE